MLQDVLPSFVFVAGDQVDLAPPHFRGMFEYFSDVSVRETRSSNIGDLYIPRYELKVARGNMRHVKMLWQLSDRRDNDKWYVFHLACHKRDYWERLYCPLSTDMGNQSNH